MSGFYTPETLQMERAIAALALELPGEVWDDVRDIWHAARDAMTAEIERLRANPLADIKFIERPDAFDGVYDHGGDSD